MYYVSTPAAPIKSQNDIMGRQVTECIEELLLVRSFLTSGESLTESSREELALLLHEAADLLLMRM